MNNPPPQKTTIEKDDNDNFPDTINTQTNITSTQQTTTIEANNPVIEEEKITTPPEKLYERQTIKDVFIGQKCGENNLYQIIKLIGKGGMGKVYLAITNSPEKQDELVAIKFLSKECLLAENKEEIKHRFNREIGFLIALNHPNIVKFIDQNIYQLQENDQEYSLPFYVMEYLRGQTLSDYLVKKVRLETSEALFIITQILGGLRIAHNNGIIHRDLKPDNIFLVPTINNKYIVKILDFGIARSLNTMSVVRLTNVADYFGSPYYISPEHIKGVADLDTKSDVYTLGLIFYEILSGNKPFNNYDDLLLTRGWLGVHNHKQPIPLIHQIGCENIPIALNDTIMKCLNKNPNDRYKNAEEMLLEIVKITQEINLTQKSTTIKNNQIKSSISHPTNNSKLILQLIITLIIGIVIGITTITIFRPILEENINIDNQENVS